MKVTSCFLLILILLLQLMITGSTECCSNSVMDGKIKKALIRLGFNPSALKKKISCTSVKNSGKLSSCPAGTVVTSCACGYGCGSWDVRGETTCHCQCNPVDWTTARCCRLT
ncbi:resistin-like beta [Equus asinus]|uniref:Resistin like beta n=1 Tax=Equus asinus TaxID=9793 RepID=A0A9L0I3X7_EQUAS|nr:resistin-like beta [Equus asinus]XP_044627573.1 resistin-like beta [Equus asinus]